MLGGLVKKPSRWKYAAAVTVLAAGAAATTNVVLKERFSAPAAETSEAKKEEKRRPHLYLPTVRTSLLKTSRTSGLFFYAIKDDGTTWERSLVASATSSEPMLAFSPAKEIPQAKNARAFGESIIALQGGGVLTRQPITGEWSKFDGMNPEVSKAIPEVSGQDLIRLIFPDVYLFSGGAFLQQRAPMGTKAQDQRFKGAFYIQPNVVQFGLSNRAGVAALLSNGDVLSSAAPRGQSSITIDCTLGDAVSLSVSDFHGVAALADGTVSMWGDLSMGQLGSDGGTKASKPVQVPGLKNIAQVMVSKTFQVIAMALDYDGHVWLWGSIGPARTFLPPKQVQGLDDVTYVDFDTGGIALKKDGTAWVFPALSKEAPQQVFDHVKPIEDLPTSLPSTSTCSPGAVLSETKITPPDPEYLRDMANIWLGLQFLAALAVFAIGYLGWRFMRQLLQLAGLELAGAEAIGVRAGRGAIPESEAVGVLRPGSVDDLLKPSGQLIGVVEKGATPNIRTVTADEFRKLESDLMGMGAKKVPADTYQGAWYELPNGQGGFGIRSSTGSGRTIDFNLPDYPKGLKVHQK